MRVALENLDAPDLGAVTIVGRYGCIRRNTPEEIGVTLGGRNGASVFGIPSLLPDLANAQAESERVARAAGLISASPTALGKHGGTDE
jgi:hypothetical protein